MDQDEMRLPDGSWHPAVDLSKPIFDGLEGIHFRELIRVASEANKPIGTFLMNSRLRQWTPDRIVLAFDDPYTMGILDKEENREIIREAAVRCSGYKDIAVIIEG